MSGIIEAGRLAAESLTRISPRDLDRPGSLFPFDLVGVATASLVRLLVLPRHLGSVPRLHQPEQHVPEVEVDHRHRLCLTLRPTLRLASHPPLRRRSEHRLSAPPCARPE